MGRGEATFVGDGGGEKSRRRWAWVAAGALTAVALAIFVGSRIALEIPASVTNSCECLPGSRSYTGLVEDCCCDYETANSLNAQVLHPILQDLVKTPLFRYFKVSYATWDFYNLLPWHTLPKEHWYTLVKLWCDCPFLPDDGMCYLRDCTVCECPESEFPEPFKKSSRLFSADEVICQEGKPQAAVDRTLDNTIFKGWIQVDNLWTYDDETDDAAMTYVNLQLNSERYTGYAGPSAQRIWTTVYKENCPQYPSEEWCNEKKVMYKLISGLHSSISVHIASEYLLDSSANLAADYLEQAECNTGNHVEDLKTQSLVRQLLYNNKLLSACSVPSDEVNLWQGQNGPDLLQQIQNQFRNISAIMNCVGCEKCRLWGKLQVNGLATALKVLFFVDGKNNVNKTLQRNEVIALFNLLNRLSQSVKFVHDMGPLMEKRERHDSSPTGKTPW